MVHPCGGNNGGVVVKDERYVTKTKLKRKP